MISRHRSMLAVIFAAGLLLAIVSSAEAQLQQPRCDGNPPRGGGTNVLRSRLIGYAGIACYGQIFSRVGRGRGGVFRAGSAIESIQVIERPAQGRFEMIGLRDFRYTPSATMRGWDRIVLQFVRDSRGQRHTGRIVFRATTREFYDASGGEAGMPGRGGHGRRR